MQDYRSAYADGAATPSSAIADVYGRIAAYGDAAVFIALRPIEAALADARALEGQGPQGRPLYGIPVAVKDNIDVAGLPTTAGCADFAYTPEVDAIVVARLRAAGAIIIGKTNLDQFATGLVGVRSPYGVPRNTIDPALAPGGSSSGSGVAVAAGLVPVALGTDTAGSGRVPAGLNAIVGLKPSLGALPTTGVVPACRSLDCVSVFAHSVADAWELFSAMAGPDAADPYSRQTLSAPARPADAPLRVGVPDAASRRFGGDALSEAAFDAALSAARAAGAALVPIDLTPFYATAALLYDGPWVAERYAAIRPFIEAQPEALLPITHGIIAGATRFSAADAFAGLYRLAELKAATSPVWADIDTLMVPTFPRPRTLADLEADPLGPNAELGTYTNFVNLLDLCALAVPGPARTDGWPAGVTFIGPAGHDADIADIAGRLFGTPGAASLPAPSAHGAVAPIELVVVGAHLSGLALNHELTSRGGRLLRAGQTTSDYRLFALAGGPPHRPGLLRVAEGAGRPIETEVWALEPQAFASFVAAVPSPLSIGTVRLADGSRPKGFLVEVEATHDAADISHFGGWRSFCAAPPQAQA
nr:allophanate hydrolase [Chelatococcus reniformis]